MKWKKFTKDKRSTLSYWWWHNLAFNYTAIKCHAWKFKYIFHDIEKPILMLLWRNYKKVQRYHRRHSNHHIEFPKYYQWDLEAMILDWECSQLTKAAAQLNALDTLKATVVTGNPELYINDSVIRTSLIRRMPDILQKLRLIDYEEKIKLQSDLIYNRQQVELYNKEVYAKIKTR